jgi:hypothetical protein
MKVLGRFRLVRMFAPFVCNRRLARPPINNTSLFPALDVDESVRLLRADGLCLGIDLSDEFVNEIVGYAATRVCFGNINPKCGFPPRKRREAEAISGQRFVLGGYFNTTAPAGCNAIRYLERDPKLWAIAEGFLGTVPRHIGNQLWWSFADERSVAEKRRYAQLYHYDLDGYAFLKFFFYLTEVPDEQAGPHVCVRGTHRRKVFRHRLRYTRFSDEEVLRCYGADKVATIYGKAGSGFAEDTYCLHKGLAPTGRDRLILQIQFALHDFGVQHDGMAESALRQIL